MKKFKVKSNYDVSETSLHIVKRTDNKEVQRSVSDFAESCGISLAAAKRSSRVLARLGIIKMSKENPDLYVYKSDLLKFDRTMNVLEPE